MPIGETDPSWGPIQKIPPVKRGTSKRRARAGGMHMSDFWKLSKAERDITYAISRAGKPQRPRG